MAEGDRRDLYVLNSMWIALNQGFEDSTVYHRDHARFQGNVQDHGSMARPDIIPQ